VPKKVNLILGVHDHQPVGNFGSVFEQAYEDSYGRFLDVLEANPILRVALHCSGPLLEWMEDNRPDFFERVRVLISRGQVEMLSGGFYEPLLPVLPPGDAVGQLRMMNDYVAERFGANPRGFWLAERVWEPSIPSVAAAADLHFTMADDTHFLYAGLRADQLYGYYTTEDQNNVIAVFPIDQMLRYTIPFREPEETVDYLRSVATEDGDRMVCLADDGEKFGVWPGTREWVYEDGWMDRFIKALQENADWINIVHFSEYMADHPPLGKVYLPTASYEEMTEWALPPDAGARLEDLLSELRETGRYDEMRPYIRGGFWRNFLVKYPESNNMYRKMLRVSGKLASLNGDARDAEMTRALWRGQCNCSYWHGVFGGLYLNYLRAAVYENLIRAENAADASLRAGDDWLHVERTDFDADGHEEVLIESPAANWYVAPACGGALFELDVRGPAANLIDTLSRRPEAYHRKILEAAARKGEDEADHGSIHELDRGGAELAGLLHYDSGRRLCFVDRFLPLGSELPDLATCRYTELGDFAHGSYDCTVHQTGDGVSVHLRRSGACRGGKSLSETLPVCVEKTYRVPADGRSLRADYSIRNDSKRATLACLFGVEMNVAMLAPDAPDRFYDIPGADVADRRPVSVGVQPGVGEVSLVDEWRKVRLNLSLGRPAVLWWFPIETISQSESAYDQIYQCSCQWPHWKLELGPGQSENLTLELEVITWR